MNLIIVTSPLQVLIAERIMAEHPNEEFDAVMYTRMDNDKYRYYTDRLRALCRRVDYVVIHRYPGKLKVYARTLGEIYQTYLRPRYKRIYIASIDSDEGHRLLTFQSKASIYTFDDGLVNLDPPAWQKVLRVLPSGWKRMLSRVFGTPTMNQLIERSQKHYTIYRLPNVMPRTHYIPLIPPITEASSRIEHTVRMLLGQHLYVNYTEQESLDLIMQVMQEYAIDLYIPHPKFGQDILGDKEVKTPLIFEDYILQELQKNPTTHYEVYLFSTTSSINLVGVHPRLSFVSIKPKDSPKIFDETYRIIAEAGIPVLPRRATRE